MEFKNPYPTGLHSLHCHFHLVRNYFMLSIYPFNFRVLYLWYNLLFDSVGFVLQVAKREASQNRKRANLKEIKQITIDKKD